MGSLKGPSPGRLPASLTPSSQLLLSLDYQATFRASKHAGGVKKPIFSIADKQAGGDAR